MKLPVPPLLLAVYDHLAVPRPAALEAEALNGQRCRQRMFEEIFRQGRFVAVVETGTFRGATTEYLATAYRLPVHTVESSARFYHYSRIRLRNRPLVHLYRGDSRSFLRRLADDPAFPKKRVFFYLDAHWNKDLPLLEEIRLILDAWSESIIVIDDFEVPGDDYLYDAYSETDTLSTRYLKPLDRSRYEIFWPSAPASSETGMKRGCAVLATRDAMLEGMENWRSIRKGAA